jgi:hypothetical protein
MAGGKDKRHHGRSTMSLIAALSLLVGLAALTASGAQADSAGRKPSEAPLVTVGQHYFGNTANSRDGNASGSISNGSVDLWRLPPLLTSDAITVAWHVVTNDVPGLCLAQNIDDYNWAQEGNICNGSNGYLVAGNGSARTIIQAKSATSDPFLEFYSGCFVDPPDEVDNCPYDFVIESIQHAIGIGLTPAARIKPTSTLTGSANLSNGSPVPDGLAFTLTATWVTPVNKASHSRSYTAATSGGALAFPLNLPSSAQSKRVSLTVTRPADPQYLAASSPAREVMVETLTRRHHRGRHHHRHRHQHRGPDNVN